MDEKLTVFVKERKLRCFKYDNIWHVRAECNLAHEETKVKGEEEKEKEIIKETESSIIFQAGLELCKNKKMHPTSHSKDPERITK